MSEDRLQKILSRAGVASRRQSEELIREGRVTVNGEVAELGRQADPHKDAIKVDGKRVQPMTAHLYYLLNKPDSVMSTRDDPEGRPTVMELVPEGLRSLLVPVGRLDYHSEGLLLLTNDGDLAQKLTHPRYGCVKVYEAKVKGAPGEAEVEKLRQGIVLDGKRTRPVGLRRLRASRGARRPSENTWWQVELAEGRTRQIREMFFRIGHPVQRLKRVAIGSLSDPHLPPGEIRTLTDAEVQALRDVTAKPAKRPRKPRAAAAARKSGPGKGGPGKSEGGKSGGSKSAGARPAGRKGAGPKGDGSKGGGPKGRGRKGPGPKPGGSRSGGPKSRSPKPGGPRGGGGNRGPRGGGSGGGPRGGGRGRGGRS